MKEIEFNQDIEASIINNCVKLTTIIEHPQIINDYTTVSTLSTVKTQLDINTKEFWELVKHAAVKLRLNTPNTNRQEIAMAVAEAAIAIQNTMDE